MSKKKILVLASTFPRWKNDTTPPFVFELEKRLGNGLDISVLAPHFKGAKKFEKLENLKVYRFQYFWPASLQKLCYEGGILPNIKRNKFLIIEALTLVLFELLSTLRLVRSKKIDLIHAHWIIPQGIVAMITKKILKTPYIVTTHGGDIYGLQGGLLSKIKAFVLQNADSITVVSNAIKEEIHKKINPNLNIQVISMGVDSKLFNPNKYDENLKIKHGINGPFLLFVGRLAEKKGVKYLIDAMSRVVAAHPDTKLLIIGDGTLRSELVEQTRKLKLEKHVTFLGPVENRLLPKYYATADIFIGPSIKVRNGDTEGLGLTFAEASLSGTICIGTNVGGISDVIKTNETGYIINSRDSEEISNTVIKIITKKLKPTFPKMIEITKSTFDWDVVKEKYKSVYQQII